MHIQSRKIQKSFWLIALSTLLSISFGQTSILQRATNWKDVKDHPLGTSTYNEFWTYHFQLNDSIYMVLNFSRANLGKIKDPVCGADLVLLGFRNKNYAVAREYPLDKYIWNNEQQSLNVHKDIWFKGALPKEHEVFFKTTKNNISYHIQLNFSQITNGLTLGSGEFKVGSDRVGMFLHIPKAEVQGIIAIQNDTIPVKGYVSMDHTYQSNMGTKISERGWRYQSFKSKAEVAYLIQPKGESRLLGFIATEKDSGNWGLEPVTQWHFGKMHSVKGIDVPESMSLFTSKDQIQLSLGNSRHIHSVLSEFSGLSKMVVKQFMGGELLMVRGPAKLGEKPAFYHYFAVK